MKKNSYFLLLFCFVLINQNVNAQFSELFNKAKQMFNEKLNDASNKYMSKAIDYVSSSTDRIFELSGKQKKSSNSNDQLNSNSNYTPSSNTYIPVNETEKFIKDNYPNFYVYYDYVSQDPLVNNIVFLLKDQHTYLCNTNFKGKIFYDMFYFEDLSKPRDEEMKSWSILIMLGYLHASSEQANLSGSEKEYFAYNYAIHKARYFAENGNCYALKRATHYWKARTYQPNESIKSEARNRIIQTSYYKECEQYYNSKCNFN